MTNQEVNKIKIAINGFGRIGRAFFRLLNDLPSARDAEVVAINDLGDRDNLEYLLKYDSVYGRASARVLEAIGRAQWLQERDPSALPWGEMNIDVVVESTGIFRDMEKARAHIDAGAKRVVISAPSKDVPTVLMGVNEDDLAKSNITCNASCTTNAGSPVIGILHETIGIERAMLSTVHGYTATQSIVDGANKKDPRRGRAAAVNIIPTSTGAAVATTKAHTSLEGKFDGIAIRVPVPAGSIADITFVAKRDTTVEEVNDVLKKASENPRWKDVFAITDEPLVSTDIIGRPKASIADLSMTRVVGGTLVKVLAWYDNEVGYASALVKHVLATR